jgi:asparagine synthase (glutamine-hydrolysing)
MSGICGFIGPAAPGVLDAMLAAIDYRGDTTDTALVSGVGLGHRYWKGRPGKSAGVCRDGAVLSVCAGTMAPPHASPAADLPERLRLGSDGLGSLDGAFAGAVWDGAAERLSLVRDPFGVRSLYYTEHAGVFYFASELKQLLAVPGIPVEVDLAALHKYLTFSFVPGEDVPIRGIKRLLPGRVAVRESGRLTVTPYFALSEALDPELADPRAAGRKIRRLWREAVRKRLLGEPEVGLFLSGGIDSSGVGLWLREEGVPTRAFTLDFGAQSVEREEAATVAESLGLPLDTVTVGGEDLVPVLADLVWKLDLPFGDPVTGPQYLMGRAARQRGLTAVFNGEGGDQLFGGWTSKPMIAAEIYADLYGEDTREETYLRSYHRFYGLEAKLYTADFRAQVGGPGQRRAHLAPYLASAGGGSFLNHVRLADISLKGSQSILPRAERMANAWGLDVRVPLFDRALAEASFALPPNLKLHGATEKYILKRILSRHLPAEIVWRRKFGMSVPITDWVMGPLGATVEALLGSESLARRGYFRSEYVETLRRGQNDPHETRRRRLGERLWTLVMLEAWLRVFVDGRGRRPGASL